MQCAHRACISVNAVEFIAERTHHLIYDVNVLCLLSDIYIFFICKKYMYILLNWILLNPKK